MGRKRKTKTGLPIGWHFKHGAFYYKVQAKYKHLFEKQWIRLGSTLPDAHRAFADLPVHKPIDPDAIITIDDLADYYEKEIYPTNSTMTQANKRAYMPSVRIGLGEIPVKAIRKSHAKTLYRALKPLRGNKTARECVALLRHMMTVAEELDLVEDNPIIGLKLPKNKPRRRLVSYGELSTFIDDFAGPLISVYLKLKRITGMDKQMLLALRMDDIKEDGLHTQRHKNDSLPKIYEYDEAGELLAVLDEIKLFRKKKRDVPSVYLFCNRKGQPYLPLQNGKMFDDEGHAFGTPEGFNSIWQRKMAKWVKAGNERFTEHDIRKVPASSTTTEHAQDLLDHHSPEITKRVYQVGKKVVSIQSTPEADS